ncbi:phosphomannomutase/phosphoglucomutase [Candidatus Uhrbacteria bacterium]|nr:phosphomannomutase/phosphoglucomutase [Candidatus Uhrbacteria bacterium]
MEHIPTHIFKAYDIRGLVPGEITLELAYRVGRVVAASGGAYVVGRDMRASSPALSDALMRGMNDAGAEVIDVGLVSTPTFYFAVRTMECAGGVQVTASHNPKEYNGLKVVGRAPDAVLKVGRGSGMEAIRDAVCAGVGAPTAVRGSVRTVADVVTAEARDALAILPVAQLPPLRIVADAGNGMGALYLDAIAREIGIDLDRLYFALDGTFPNHPPDPLQAETLRDLQERVRATGADLGIATDGDGDRFFLLDEHGTVIPPSLITALVATELLRDHPGERVLVDVRYIRNARAAIERAGGVFGMSPVGHALISNRLRQEHGLFAGESSGHSFFRATGYAEEPLLVLLAVLRVLARERRPFSEVLQPFRVAQESGEVNFRLPDAAAVQRCFATLRARYADAEFSDLDGCSFTYPEWRANVRSSNTEPLLRLNVEGSHADVVAQQCAAITAFITESVGAPTGEGH